MKMTNEKCMRSACDNPLRRGYWAIFNQPSKMLPRLYCPRCGRSIHEASPELEAKRFTGDGREIRS